VGLLLHGTQPSPTTVNISSFMFHARCYHRIPPPQLRLHVGFSCAAPLRQTSPPYACGIRWSPIVSMRVGPSHRPPEDDKPPCLSPNPGIALHFYTVFPNSDYVPQETNMILMHILHKNQICSQIPMLHKMFIWPKIPMLCKNPVWSQIPVP
jgi:hypothetical protein